MKKYENLRCFKEVENKELPYSVYQKGDVKALTSVIVDAYNEYYPEARYKKDLISFTFKQKEIKSFPSKPLFIKKFVAVFEIEGVYKPAELDKKGSGKIIKGTLELETTYQVLKAETELVFHANFKNLINGDTNYIQYTFV